MPRSTSTRQKNVPGCDCCANPCTLLVADFTDLATVQTEWTRRAGSWANVAATGTELELQAAGLELLAIAEPNLAPYGVRFQADFQGPDDAVLRFFAGAATGVSVFAEITLAADCGTLRFYEEALTGETRVGDVHVVRELRGDQWHTLQLCYDPARSWLTARIRTAAGETWSFSARATSTAQPGWGLGVSAGSAKFRAVSAAAVGDFTGPCADVTVTTTREGSPTSDYSLILGYTTTDFSQSISLYAPDGTGAPQTTAYASSGKTEAQVANEILEWLVVAAANLGYSSAFTVVFQRGASDCVLTITPDPDGPYGGDLSGIAWLTAGESTRQDVYGINERQQVTLTGSTTGTFRLTFDAQTTADIAATANAATVQSSLESLSTIGTGNVSVTGPAGAWLVEFIGDLAKTSLSQMTAQSSLATCESYGNAIAHCPVCNPGCDLAGSPFSGSLSACDWDAAGWTFADGTATGTGTLTHQAELWTAPYVYRCAIDLLAYPHSAEFVIDAQALTLDWRRVADDADWVYYLDLTDGLTTLHSFALGTFADGSDPDPAQTIELRVCRLAASLYILASVAGQEYGDSTTAAEISGPGYIGFDTDQPDTVLTLLRATRHGGVVQGCDDCAVTADCEDGCSGDSHSDAATVDVVGMESVTAGGGCPCAFLNSAFELDFRTSEPPISWCRYELETDWPAGWGTCHNFAADAIRYAVRAYLTVPGSAIDVSPSHRVYSGAWNPTPILSTWVPENDHYYTLVTVELQVAGSGHWVIYYFAHDWGTQFVKDCTALDDVECLYRGCSDVWRDPPLGGYPPCGTQGAEISPGSGQYYVQSAAVAFLTT